MSGLAGWLAGNAVNGGTINNNADFTNAVASWANGDDYTGSWMGDLDEVFITPKKQDNIAVAVSENEPKKKNTLLIILALVVVATITYFIIKK